MGSAHIKVLKENELVNGIDNSDVYPVTSSQAIFRQNPNGSKPEGVKQRLEDTLQDHEEDAKELHRKAEKLVVYLSNDKVGQTLEITGDDNTMTLTGSAQVETYGDEPSQAITPEEMTSKRMIVTSSGDTLYDEGVVTTTFTLPNVVGQYTATFTAEYNGISKSASNSVNVNLKKYFGFAEAEPTDPTALGVSHFSNSVGCTVTIPANGTGFKRIYFAVPSAMTINRIVQPDALNAPLAITQVGTISRTIGSSTFTYKLYRSDDLIDSSLSKRLTIS